MTYSFNLIDQAWIPCLRLDGQLETFSLYDMFANAQHLKGIACETPIMTAAIYPLALAILHRVYGPARKRDWLALWESESFPLAPLEAYLREWYERFDLFHPEYPFYQVPDERVKPKSVIHLIHSIGNTATLFTHANDEDGLSLTPAEAARHLLTAQYFRTAGLSGLDEKFTDSPMTRGVLFWALGTTLFETLVLNLMIYPSEQVFQYTDADKPIWEADDAYINRDIPNGYLDYLTWPSNRILLIPEGAASPIVRTMTVAPGLSVNMEVKNPQKLYTKREKKDEISWSFLYFNSDKALWRDYHSLVMVDDGDIRPPAVVEWLSELAIDGYIDDRYALRLSAQGMLADQAKPIFYRQEAMPIPVGLLKGEINYTLITLAITQADNVAEQLRYAVNTLADNLLLRGAEGKPDSETRKNLTAQWDVLSIYWGNLEPQFWDFIAALTVGKDTAPEDWKEELRKAAFSALEQASRMAGDSPWALKGDVIARRLLSAGLKKVFN